MVEFVLRKSMRDQGLLVRRRSDRHGMFPREDNIHDKIIRLDLLHHCFANLLAWRYPF